MERVKIDMNVHKFNRRRNKLVFSCWLTINVILTFTCIMECAVGRRGAYHFTQHTIFTWIPFIIAYGMHLVIGRSNLNIKYLVVTTYLISYAYLVINPIFTSTFCYIFPFICILIIYDDVMLIDTCATFALLINIIDIGVNELSTGRFNVSIINSISMILTFIFAHKVTKLLRYSNNKLLELNNEVTHDTLTGIHNRYYLDKFVNEQFKNPEYSELSLAIIDVDNFKYVNDTYGHKFGDLVLMKLASILKDNTHGNENTYPIRLGGDEFIIISSLLSKNELYDICVDVCNKVSNAKLRYGDTEVEFTVSIGVANSRDDNCLDYTKLYETADSALYTVKNNGKSSVAKS